jgi:small subunit ribosomal protein S2
LVELEEMKEDGRWDLLLKKEQSKLDKVYKKLQKNIGGVKNMKELPGAIFVVDSIKEEIAVAEARKVNIPIIAIVDTNGDPDGIDFPVPGNDDALRAIELFTSKISEAVMEAKKKRIEKQLQESEEEESKQEKSEEEQEEQEEMETDEEQAEESSEKEEKTEPVKPKESSKTEEKQKDKDKETKKTKDKKKPEDKDRTTEKDDSAAEPKKESKSSDKSE